jgi:lipoate-protein ligase A
MNWTYEKTSKQSASFIMEKDTRLLESVETPTLHFYEWQNDSATYGCFTNPQHFLNLDNVKKQQLDLAKRPTGGGIVFHLTDLAFSVLLPSSHKKFSINTLENYAFVNEAVIESIQNLKLTPTLLKEEVIPLDTACNYFCMAKPTIYDVIIEGKKIAGASQRRTKKGFLHQGTISIAPLCPSFLQDILLPGTKVFEAMHLNSSYLLKENSTKKEIEDLRLTLIYEIMKTLERR